MNNSIHRCNIAFPGVETSQTAAAVVFLTLPQFSAEPMVLLIHNTEQPRGDKDGSCKPAYWGNPAGGIKAEESPEKAAQRELKQETGLASQGTLALASWEHSFRFVEDEILGGQRYERCNQVMGALREGFVKQEYLRREVFTCAFRAQTELSEALEEALAERLWQVALSGSELAFGPDLEAEELEGALILLLDNEKAKKFGIVEAASKPGKRQEIDKIGLFPLSLLRRIRDEHRKGFAWKHLLSIFRAASLAPAVPVPVSVS
ncbi:MAG: NUDIX domain-containing protein [Candidatus Liptonbacteria bacterium]|nr:NUDIX domain-containing protein [Candidatus Liptonbacteria bacterium]